MWKRGARRLEIILYEGGQAVKIIDTHATRADEFSNSLTTDDNWRTEFIHTRQQTAFLSGSPSPGRLIYFPAILSSPRPPPYPALHALFIWCARKHRSGSPLRAIIAVNGSDRFFSGIQRGYGYLPVCTTLLRVAFHSPSANLHDYAQRQETRIF